MSVGGRQVASGDEFRSLGAAYDARAQELQQLTDFLQRQISGAMWQGHAATSFRGEWDMHKSNMMRLKVALDGLSRELKVVRAPQADQLNTRA